MGLTFVKRHSLSSLSSFDFVTYTTFCVWCDLCVVGDFVPFYLSAYPTLYTNINSLLAGPGITDSVNVVCGLTDYMYVGLCTPLLLTRQ